MLRNLTFALTITIAFCIVWSANANDDSVKCKSISDAIKEGYELVKIENVCLWKKHDRIENRTDWKHPNNWLTLPFQIHEKKIVSNKPISMYINRNEDGQFTILVNFLTHEYLGFQELTEVKVWYTGLGSGRIIFSDKFISLDDFSTRIWTVKPSTNLNTVKELSQAEEAIIRFDYEDFEITKETQSELRDIIKIFENHTNELK